MRKIPVITSPVGAPYRLLEKYSGSEIYTALCAMSTAVFDESELSAPGRAATSTVGKAQTSPVRQPADFMLVNRSGREVVRVLYEEWQAESYVSHLYETVSGVTASTSPSRSRPIRSRSHCGVGDPTSTHGTLRRANTRLLPWMHDSHLHQPAAPCCTSWQRPPTDSIKRLSGSLKRQWESPHNDYRDTPPSESTTTGPPGL